MNKNTSPSTRSSTRPRSKARGRAAAKSSTQPAERIARRAGASARARRAMPTTTAGKIRRMALAVAIPNVVVLLAIVVLAMGTILLTSSPMAWLPTAVAESWMVANLVPVAAGGIAISVVPMAPALILAALVAARIHSTVKDKVSVRELLYLLASVIGVPVVLTLIAWFMLWDAGRVYDVQPPNLLAALPRLLLLHLSALAFGLGARLWKALAKRYGVPRMLVDAAATARRFVLALIAASAAVALGLMIAGWSRQSEMAHQFPHLGQAGTFALVLLSVAYLPNVLVGIAATLVGSEAHIGDASMSLASIHLVPLPPLPLLGIIPGAAAPWALGLGVLTAAAAGYALYKAKPNLGHVAAAAGFTALFMAVLSYFTTGTLGVYGPAGVMVWLAAALSAVWLVLGGVVVAAVVKVRAARATAAVGASPEADDEEAAESESHGAANGDHAVAADHADVVDVAEVIDADEAEGGEEAGAAEEAGESVGTAVPIFDVDSDLEDEESGDGVEGAESELNAEEAADSSECDEQR